MRYLTATLPGTGGLLKAAPEDFVVEEIPAYLPQGDGEHTFVWLEKRLLSTQEATRALARHLGLRDMDIGVAGLKDRVGVTRQWLSLPRVETTALVGLTLTVGPGSLQVLRAERHRNKLRTGHLRGNRFTLTLRQVEGGAALGAPRAAAVLEVLRQRGVPNRYGAQRFGHGGRNESDGRRLCRGELEVRDRQRRRFLISAYQSALFNRYLDARLATDQLAQVIDGDVLQKRESGGIFSVSGAEIAEAQARVDAGAVAITGPMFGSSMRAPAPGTAAAALEEAQLREEGLDPVTAAAAFATLAGLAEGTRRALLVPLDGAGEEVGVAPHPQDDGALILRFTLPPGSYATVVLEEVMKTAVPADHGEP